MDQRKKIIHLLTFGARILAPELEVHCGAAAPAVSNGELEMAFIRVMAADREPSVRPYDRTVNMPRMECWPSKYQAAGARPHPRRPGRWMNEGRSFRRSARNLLRPPISCAFYQDRYNEPALATHSAGKIKTLLRTQPLLPWPKLSAFFTMTPSPATPKLTLDGLPPLDVYPGGRSLPSPKPVNFQPGALLGSVSGELGLRKFLES